MPCYHPRNAWRSDSGVMSFREPPEASSASFELLGIPCGNCIGCRVRKARDWALRCCLEAAEHEETAFVTLTYDDSHLPASGLLVKAHLSGWLKRLRARLGADAIQQRNDQWRAGYHGPFPQPRIRFFACGEYGEQTRRPHYHAILFGVRDSPHLQEAWSTPVIANGRPLYESDGKPVTEPLGFVRVDTCTPASISYVAGYVGKKIGDPRYRPSTRDVWYLRSELHLPKSRRERFQLFSEDEVVSERTGSLVSVADVGRCLERVPDPNAPFLLMSRRPGIGDVARRLWHQWGETAVWRGNPVPAPRYLHAAYKLMSSDEDYAALQEKKRLDMVERTVSGSQYKHDQLRAGEANALSRLAISNEGRSL